MRIRKGFGYVGEVSQQQKRLAFECGGCDFQNGFLRCDNPYQTNSTLRAAWFDGYNKAEGAYAKRSNS